MWFHSLAYNGDVWFNIRFGCYLGLKLEGQQYVVEFAVKRRRKRLKKMTWRSQGSIGAIPMCQEQIGEGSWWSSDSLLLGGWCWGKCHNQKEDADKNKKIKTGTKT